jgi:hypothetical protein
MDSDLDHTQLRPDGASNCGNNETTADSSQPSSDTGSINNLSQLDASDMAVSMEIFVLWIC